MCGNEKQQGGMFSYVSMEERVPVIYPHGRPVTEAFGRLVLEGLAEVGRPQHLAGLSQNGRQIALSLFEIQFGH